MPRPIAEVNDACRVISAVEFVKLSTLGIRAPEFVLEMVLNIAAKFRSCLNCPSGGEIRYRTAYLVHARGRTYRYRIHAQRVFFV